MPVFDFSNSSGSAKEQAKPVCTYTPFLSDAKEKTPEEPILVLDNTKRKWAHHASGMFANQSKHTAFEFNDTDGTWSADILRVDAQFIRFGRLPMAAQQNCLQRMGSCSL